MRTDELLEFDHVHFYRANGRVQVELDCRVS